ncbi:aminoacyl-tRNA hydrolase [Candidatus Peregrinibacteria bacterium CG10_big_fil_rev_8_21_14_0_10_55_24]|nr:MAG: aminoacyl-tRNA hydrolase [Candidatus Peregrinibacteria bacterium CG10_big_fil_rev_8_21_14_0_10_55_24]
MKPSIVIVGLGNPGASYGRTRHNAGFKAVDLLRESFGEGEWKDAQKFLSQTCEARIVTAPVLLVKPQTYMNRSGEAVRKLVDFYKLDPAHQLLVLCDDIDLPLGEIRYRDKGGPGTHNGLKSIVECLGEVFPRLRVGIGAQPAGEDLATWVLSVPSKEEEQTLQESLTTIPERVREVVLA